MTVSASKRLFFLASAVVIAVIVLLAVLYKPHGLSSKGAHRTPKQLILQTGKPLTNTTAKPQSQRTLVNIDPEAHDPKLRAEHRDFLASRPLEQHLPYRDREIGVELVNVTATGKPVLLVTYIRSQASAQQDIDNVMARYRDPGTAYVIHYRRVFG